jgi:hypothetical protein
MRKLLNKPWFVAVVAIIALLLLGNALRTSLAGDGYRFPGAAALTAGSASGAMGDAGEAEAPVKLTAREILRALSVPASVRDPFTPRQKHDLEPEMAPEPDQIDRVRLSAIWTQNNLTLVLINERICQPGDEIGRIKIDVAGQDGVWVTHWRGRDFITLGEEFVLNTPAGHRVVTSQNQKAL